MEAADKLEPGSNLIGSVIPPPEGRIFEEGITEGKAATAPPTVGALEVARAANELLKCSATWAEGD